MKGLNLRNYVAYGQNDGNVIRGKYVGKPGEYYLYIYKYENGTYLLNVNFIMMLVGKHYCVPVLHQPLHLFWVTILRDFRIYFKFKKNKLDKFGEVDIVAKSI